MKSYVLVEAGEFSTMTTTNGHANGAATTPPASSVEITTGAKGEAKHTVKVYHEHPNLAAAEAVKLYFQVKADIAEKFEEIYASDAA